MVVPVITATFPVTRTAVEELNGDGDDSPRWLPLALPLFFVSDVDGFPVASPRLCSTMTDPEVAAMTRAAAARDDDDGGFEDGDPRPLLLRVYSLSAALPRRRLKWRRRRGLSMVAARTASSLQRHPLLLGSPSSPFR
ncbi:uncharacterized protein LOC107606258 [Arachis ipaensis]|uniref:uncharacterized protein LOC107606258 n=1 Tax=Arachis ipaensis TaxID=130454 RepID=UPI0007AEE992|nr:uncharacterized protein LOC107606258 [Arachis ipaensis]